MKIKELMTTDVSVANANTPISEIANQMKSLNVGSIPVCDHNKRVIGIVTDRDLVLRGISNGETHACAQDVMSSNLVSATPDMDAHEAAALMAKNQIRRLPVVDQGNMVGIISLGDLATEKIYENEAGDALSNISEQNTKNM